MCLGKKNRWKGIGKKKNEHNTEFANMLYSGRMWPVAELQLIGKELAHKDFINFNILPTLWNQQISHDHLNFWLFLRNLKNCAPETRVSAW